MALAKDDHIDFHPLGIQQIFCTSFEWLKIRTCLLALCVKVVKIVSLLCIRRQLRSTLRANERPPLFPSTIASVTEYLVIISAAAASVYSIGLSVNSTSRMSLAS